MAEAFDPDDVEKYFTAIAAAARGLAGAKTAKKVAAGGAMAAGKMKEDAGAVADKVSDVATQVPETPEKNKKLEALAGVKQQMDQRSMQAEQQKREQHQRASEMARSAASTGTTFAKAQSLMKEEVLGSDQHAKPGDPRFWDVMSHYGYYDPSAVNQAFEPYPIKELTDLTPQVNELITSYGYEPYYFGGRFPMPDLSKKNYNTGHLAIYDPEVRTAGFTDAAFTDNWRKLHELGHGLGLEDINNKWGEGRRLGRIGVRTPREMLRAVDWERAAMENQRDLMNEVGLTITPEAQYNKDWNTTIGDAAYRAITGKFTSPEKEGFVPFSEKIPLDIAMRKVRERADELGLDMDETLRDKRGGARKIASEPMDLAWRLLKQQTFNDYFGKSNEFMEDAFDLGYELVDYDDLHDKQRAIVDLISSDERIPYWTDPASGEYETEHYNGMFQPDKQHLYSDEAFDQYHRYLQHYFEAAKGTAALPREKQLFLMSGTEEGNSHPEHPNNIALARMAEEFPEWDVENPHKAFYYRYNSPEPQRGLASRMASGGFLRSEVLVKERKSPEAMRHKREYDAAYNKRPDQVKYREELNQERRRRGIMGSHNHMDVSHTQGGKLTLEGEHSNRSRHFKDKGTLRVMKSMKDDLELLRNLMQGPMDEQDKKIATAMVGMLEERHGDEEEEDELMRPLFGGGDLFA